MRFSSSLLSTALLVPSWPGLLVIAQRRGEEEVLRGGGRRQGSQVAKQKGDARNNVERRLPSTHLEQGSLVCDFDPPHSPSQEVLPRDALPSGLFPVGPGYCLSSMTDYYDYAYFKGTSSDIFQSCVDACLGGARQGFVGIEDEKEGSKHYCSCLFEAGSLAALPQKFRDQFDGSRAEQGTGPVGGSDGFTGSYCYGYFPRCV